MLRGRNGPAQLNGDFSPRQKK
uniref:Uncharacterized protein n=1 Tax=Arundo donax TaxID=35708 RepID=A0A0A9CK37_ARUDO